MTQTSDKSPPLIVKAKNLMGAVARTAARALHGEGVQATPSEQEARWSKCTGCPRNRDGECLECGCVLALKIPVASEFCDLGEWGPVRGKPRNGVVRGKDILDAEIQVRELVPPGGHLNAAFNHLHQRLAARLRCKSCEKAKLLRKLETALSHDIRRMEGTDLLELRNVLPNRTKIMLETLRSWDDIIQERQP